MSNQKPKILLITNDLGPRAGGIESFILGLLKRLPQGSVIVYTSSQPKSESFDKDLFDKYGVIIIRDRSKILLPTPRITRRAVKLMNQFDAKLIWFGAAAPLALMAAHLRKNGANRIIALTHGHEVWWAKLPIFRQLLSKISKDVDVLTYLGEYTKNAIKKVVSDQSKLIKIAPGIDVDHFQPSEKSNDLIHKLNISNRPVIVSVGRLVHRKGQDKLIVAMSQVIKDFPTAVLLLVGEGPIKYMLQKLVQHHSLEKNVIFAGRVQLDELPRYIQLGQIFAMPARDRFFGLEVEGLGIVYLEASACALPVIVGDSGGAPDAVISEKTGLIVDGTSPDQIANSIKTLLQQPELAKRYGAAGREWVVNEWRWEIWSKRFNSLLLN
jgi:phosphatidylinositol alpha-1,6-mannosyltransferase